MSTHPIPAAFAALRWYLLKLPLTLALIVAGFIVDFVVAWPFALLCRLDRPRGET